ncbi:glucose 1-dehydrogenase [Parvibaculum sp.]|jgi:3-oxoacyl-[acyl-carrier protein] reductase|uniref:SDR family NAD(P)-dependent oxidoreductase n=1 Tax=Parvibaculum sp. TaxID=2024848 RepID=UPI001B043003|nr:glucose 1-dehydrogenase [Parvibaculum sp.]MBO6669740.1 glucose 1-dehydrogenase [Parvibaculum sp.]MBO6693534.1 glucose 1-dehydrogenase [Parvibaculum sp.]MBO6716247.1 glucose 1-dehydrogenase [Parvibaculum sp.]|tara:strand:+ start:3655 stop:4446 length:792 start_codon:yes stop_codon:yes gene_type:complete
MSSLKGKVAIVTGSATGLGAAVALQLADKGCNVVINYTKSEKEAKDTLAACEAKGVEALLAQGDVGEDADCRRIVDETVKKWGRVDVLVNNAGGTKFANHAELDELNAEDFLWIYKVNVVGAYQMIRACAPHMKQAGKGSVVNVSSIAGVTGIGSSVAYAASKGALNTMTLSLARSLAPKIRVNAVCPGFIGTRWFSDRFGQQTFEGIKRQQEESTPLARAGTPEDIATAVVFFCGEGSDHITGETLITDAGMHLGFAPLTAR